MNFKKDLQNNSFFSISVIIFLAIIIVFAFFPMLLNRAFFWDDWYIGPVSIKDSRQLFYITGSYIFAFFLSFIKIINNDPRFFRVIIFFSYVFSSYFLHKILKKSGFSQSTSFWISLLTLLTPMNFARVGIIGLGYAVTYFSFFLATHIIINRQKIKLIPSLITNFLLFFSLTLNSLILFYPFIHLIVFKNSLKHQSIIKKIIIHLKNNYDHLLTLCLFFIARATICKTHGMFADYNKIEFKHMEISASLYFISDNYIKIFNMIVSNIRTHYWLYFGVLFFILLGLFKMLRRKFYNFTSTIDNPFSIIYFWLLICLVIVFPYLADGPVPTWKDWNSLTFAALFFILLGILEILKRKFYNSNNEIDQPFNIIFLGLLLCILAVIPYLSVGKRPGFVDWNGRFQLLLPIGASFTLYGLFSICNYIPKIGFRIFTLLLILCLSGFVVTDFIFYSEYQRLSLKQAALISLFKKNSTLRDNYMFQFNDLTSPSFAIVWQYRFYELNGMLKQAFGTETRMGVVNPDDFAYFNQYIPIKGWHMSDFKCIEPKYSVDITLNNDFLSKMPLLPLSISGIYLPSYDEEKIENSFNVTVKKANL